MEFEEFKNNVEQWAEERGIYEQSTEAHQQAKALEEIGEYLTAENDDERMDAIGDIAVCIVNAAYFRYRGTFPGIAYSVHDEMHDVARQIVYRDYLLAMGILHDLSVNHKYEFENCLKKAWNEIKDRKGRMIDGKFVKSA